MPQCARSRGARQTTAFTRWARVTLDAAPPPGVVAGRCASAPVGASTASTSARADAAARACRRIVEVMRRDPGSGVRAFRAQLLERFGHARGDVFGRARLDV